MYIYRMKNYIAGNFGWKSLTLSFKMCPRHLYYIYRD